MKINGTIINYYYHCKRQCYLFSNRINMEDNSEDVRIGRVLHEIRAKDEKNAEIKYENMVLDKINKQNIEEYKKSDADIEAAEMQLLFYLKNLEDKGIKREGRLIFEEKNKAGKSEKVVLNDKSRNKLNNCIKDIEKLLGQSEIPKVEKKKTCKRCSYYDYCYI